MKVFIGLALLSVAFATPLMPPLTLPEAPLPAMESVELPQRTQPSFEASGSVSTFETPDIKPLMIPQVVIDEINKLKNQEGPVDAVRVVEIAEHEITPSLQDEAAPGEETANSVFVVDHVDETARLEVVPTNVDDNVDPVRVVEAPTSVSDDRQARDVSVEESLPEIKADPVIFVDNSEVPIVIKRDTLILKPEPVKVERVIVVDHLDHLIVPETEIVADPVRIVNIAPPVLGTADVFNVARVPVILVPYPEKYYDNPLLR